MHCDNAVHCSQVTGRTKSAEVGEKTQDVNIFYTQPLKQIPVYGTTPEINITQVMAVDKQSSYARFVVLIRTVVFLGCLLCLICI